MSIRKILSNKTILKNLEPTFEPIKRCIFECGEKEDPCKSNKCKKKYAPCQGLPVSSPEEKQVKDWSTEELKVDDNDRLKPLPPKKPKDPKFCSKVSQLSSESTKNHRKSHCCFPPNKEEKSKKPKLG